MNKYKIEYRTINFDEMTLTYEQEMFLIKKCTVFIDKRLGKWCFRRESETHWNTYVVDLSKRIDELYEQYLTEKAVEEILLA